MDTVLGYGDSLFAAYYWKEQGRIFVVLKTENGTSTGIVA